MYASESWGQELKQGSAVTSRRLQAAFEKQLGEHQRIVFKVAAIYARGVDDRRDLEQEICTQAWRSFGRYDERKAKFSTWLYRVALNVSISQARRQSWAQADRVVPLESWHLDSIGGGETIDEPDERLVELYRFIGQLDVMHRALMLLYLEDRSYAEIAEILGISQTNVATKIGRIKEKLRGQMTGAVTTGA